MTEPGGQRPIPPAPSPPADLRLRNWLLRDEPLTAAAVLAGAALAAALAGSLSHSWPMGLLSLAALWLALWRAWLPVHFELGSKGVARTLWRRTQRLPWRAIARWESCRQGIVVYPDLDDSPLGRMRGWYIAAPGRRDELIRLAKYYLSRRTGRSDSSFHQAG